MSSQPAAAPAAPKSRWDSLFTVVPVTLTVIATILAGQSSGEMTQAQYHRTLAAQHQNKASDQWALFQAKRERQTIQETTLDLLGAMALPRELGRPDVDNPIARVSAEQRRVAAEADRFANAVDKAALLKAKAGLGLPLSQAVDAAQELKKIAKDPIIQLPIALGDGAPHGDPSKELDAELAAIHPDIPKFLEAALRTHETDSALAGRASTIPDDKVQQAIETSQATMDAADKANGDGVDLRKNLDLTTTHWASRCRFLIAAARDAKDAAEALPAGDDKDAPEIRSAAEAAIAAADRTRASLQDAISDIKAERLAYNAHRYRREADLNMTLAGLYELQVQRSGLTSDRHRERSKWFFFGMLAAQLGVTIATLALGVRRKSVLVILAALAGVAAILITGYVYVYLFDWNGFLPPAKS